MAGVVSDHSLMVVSAEDVKKRCGWVVVVAMEVTGPPWAVADLRKVAVVVAPLLAHPNCVNFTLRSGDVPSRTCMAVSGKEATRPFSVPISPWWMTAPWMSVAVSTAAECTAYDVIEW